MMTSQTDDITLWPVLRTVKEDFLSTIGKFFVFFKGESALLFARDARKSKVYALGKNSSDGLLGVGHTEDVLQPTEVVELSGLRIDQVVCQWYSVLVLTTDGDLYAWGSNGAGQLGIGDTVDQIRPVKVVGKKWRIVKSGFVHVAAVDENGSLWCWGWSCYYQTGLDSTTNALSPVEVKDLASKQVVQVECGLFNTLALTSESTLYIFGKFGALVHKKPIEIRLGFTITTLAPSAVDLLALATDGSVHSCYFDGQNASLQSNTVDIDNGEKVKSVFAGLWHDVRVLVLQSGQLVVWHGQGHMTYTSLSSVADVFALYGAEVGTPSITTLPSVVAQKCSDPLSPSSQLNNPTHTFTLNFRYNVYNTIYGGKKLHLSPKVASNVSNYLAKQFEGAWKDQSSVYIDNYEYCVWFAYLAFVTCGYFQIESDWAFELLALATEFDEDQLKQKCLEYIDKHQLNDPNDILRPYKVSARGEFVAQYLSNTITRDTCCVHYQVAVDAKDESVQDEVVRFVAGQDWRLLSCTDGFHKARPEVVVELLGKAGKLFQDSIVGLNK